MDDKRIFLGWNRPLCETVPEWLLRNAGGEAIDLRGMAVGVPTRQSSRRLSDALPLAAQERYGAALIAPKIMTASTLIAPPTQANRASDFQALLAWCAVLREARPEEMTSFLGRRRPASAAWALQVARRIIQLRHDLAEGGLLIADVIAKSGMTDEVERWQDMTELERRYLERLQTWGVSDPGHDQIEHARRGVPPPGIEHVVLAAVPDPPDLLLTFFAAWKARGGKVTILVAAPECEADAFDAWGRPLRDVWPQREIPVLDRDLVPAADPEDQAARIAALIKAGLPDGSVPKPEQAPAVAIGVPDRETVAPLQRELAALNLPAFDPRNRPFADTALFRLVQTLLEWRERSGYAETAALLRHPHVMQALQHQGLDAVRVLRELDTVQAAGLPVTFDDLRNAVLPGRGRETGTNGGNHGGEEQHESGVSGGPLSAALTWLQARRRELGDPSLCEGLRAVLKAVYDKRLLQSENLQDETFQQAADAMDTVLRELAAAESGGQAGGDAASVLMARLQGVMLKPERAGEALDLEGWLELAWNPAPVLYAAGMNEGYVPDGSMADLFLPDTLRQKLEYRDDRSRLARDVYLLTAIRAQRSRDHTGSDSTARVVLLVGKRALAGDPLRPSRLLFRCPDRELALRARKLFGDPAPVHGAAAHAIRFKLDANLVPPAGISCRPAERMSPTSFKSYLTCPFRFYLQRMLRMESVDDRAREPDALGFGNLCHAVLQDMGRDEGRIWACGDAAGLGAWLEQRVREAAARMYGKHPWLGVTLAVESAARRLHAFAFRQVAWHAAGWEIVETETEEDQTAFGDVMIGGRIDRIDRNRETGAVCVLDYKTTDKSVEPAATHLGTAGDESFLAEAVLAPETVKRLGIGGKQAAAKRWTDLQLPLYREMVRSRYGPDAGIGYIGLPAALGETGFALWNGYHPELHQCAMDCAGAIVKRILDGVFWPPAPGALRYDDFSDLILDDPAKTFQPPPFPTPWRE